MTNLVWFRNDLRIFDNPALSKAMATGNCIAVYYITDEQWDNHGLSKLKRQLIMEHLRQLESSLSRLNVPLIIYDGESFATSAKMLINTCIEWKVSDVFFNHEYGCNELKLTHTLEAGLTKHNINLHGFHEQCIIEPGSITNGQGECYKVFGAFKKKWHSLFAQQARPIFSKLKAQALVPSKSNIAPIKSDLTCLKNYQIAIPLKALWLFSEIEAHEHLSDFVETQVEQYHLERDIPSLDSTSQLSTLLALGILTTRQCLQAVINSDQSSKSEALGAYSIDTLNEGALCWVNELVWREFYRHILVSYPRISKGRAFKIETENLPWLVKSPSFDDWCNGLTGIPIIDAAMRQLNETGWMHNRLRMVVAMFLTKHLHIDWRLGERYFYSKLCDADLASNNGGWQWSASTGVDAAPYFRIFNPYRQAERFDPNGDYVRKYVKELASIEGKAIHKPSETLAKHLNYPTVIVDLKVAADSTKSYFKNLKRQ